MKLISERINDAIEYTTESSESGRSTYFIEGVFMQADVKNKNNRIYPRKVLEKAVDDYIKEFVAEDRAVGEADHPDGHMVNLDRISHKVISLEWRGNSVIGKAQVLETPMGSIIKGLLKGGVRLGASSRGMGSVVEKRGTSYIKDDFVLSAIDLVQDPSAPTAFVDGIYEGVEWVNNNGTFEKKPDRAPQAQRPTGNYRKEAREFQRFLSKLINNRY